MLDYIHHDGGRQAAGYKGSTGDCVVRAATLFQADGNPDGADYKAMYKRMAANNAKFNRGIKSARGGVYKGAYTKVFGEEGWVKVKQAKGATKLTLTEAYETYGNIIVTTARHMMAIIDGALMDTWDSRVHYYGGEKTERKAMSIWVKPAPVKPTLIVKAKPDCKEFTVGEAQSLKALALAAATIEMTALDTYSDYDNGRLTPEAWTTDLAAMKKQAAGIVAAIEILERRK